MAILDFKQAPLGSYRDLLLPGLWGMRSYAGPRVKECDIQINFVEDCLDLVVRHTFFTHHELQDGSFKAKCRSRLEEALLANAPKDGRRITVERRSFLARAAHIRKAKPRKV